jgi:hypothetical protein
MDMTVIPLRELQTDPEGYLGRCLDTGHAFVVELPDRRRVTVSPYDPNDNLIDELIEGNAEFQTLLAKSAASPCKSFQPAARPEAAPAADTGS